MLSEQRLVQRPLLVGLTAVLAVVLGLALLASFGGPAFAQTPGTATSTATSGTSTQGQSAASPTAPSTGSGVADSGGSNSAMIMVGGIVVVAGSLAAMGYSLRKRA
jgi:hypothetical protein